MEGNWYLNIVMIVGGAIIGFVSFLEEIAKKYPIVSDFNRLGVKILLFAFGTGLVAFGQIKKDINDDDNHKTEQGEYKKERHIADSTNTADRDTLMARNQRERHIHDSLTQVKIGEVVENSYLKSQKVSTEALAKYGLRLTDSMRTVVETHSSNAQLDLVPNDLTQRTIFLKPYGGHQNLAVRFESKDGTAYHIHMKLYISHVYDSSLYHYDVRKIMDDDWLSKDINRTLATGLDSSVMNDQYLFLLFYGSFTRDIEGKRKVPFITSRMFNLKTEETISNRRLEQEYIKYLKVHNLLE